MKAYVISSAPIEYQIGEHDLYDSFSLVSQGTLDAPLKADAPELITAYDFDFDFGNIHTLITARHGQTLDTAKLLVEKGRAPDAHLVPTPYADGVRFKMECLIPKERFISLPYAEAILLARRAFVEKLFANELDESLAAVVTRMQNLLRLMKESEQAVLCVSHGFYMKLLDIYVRIPDAFASQESLLAAFEPEKRPYEPLSGFVIEI